MLPPAPSTGAPTPSPPPSTAWSGGCAPATLSWTCSRCHSERPAGRAASLADPIGSRRALPLPEPGRAAVSLAAHFGARDGLEPHDRRFGAVAIVQRDIKRMLAYSGIAHMGYALVAVIVVGTIVHSMLIQGTMETVSKTVLCALVLVATIKVIADIRVWRTRRTARGEVSPVE